MDGATLKGGLDIVCRSGLSVAVLFFMTRMMGKKQVSQLTIFDYIIGISIGSIAAELAIDNEISYSHGLIALAVYGLTAIGISFLTNKSIRARRFFTGTTLLLIENGRILERNLARVRYDVNDLLSEARNAGYFNLADVAYALLETNGKISFLPTAGKRPPTCGDLGIPAEKQGLTASVVIDGNLMSSNLKSIGRDERWLHAELQAQGVARLSDVMLATVDPNDAVSVYLKTRLVKPKTPID